MKLYAFQPNTHGPLSWFVVASDEASAREAVEAELKRRYGDRWRSEYECSGWANGGTYELTVAEPGTVLNNSND